MATMLSRNADQVDDTHLSDALQTLLDDLLGDTKSGVIHNLLDKPELWSSNYFLLLLKNLLERDKGKMAVIVPQIVARGRGKNDGEDRPERLALMAKNLLDAAIGLPKQILECPLGEVVVLLFSNTKPDANVLMIQATQKYQTEQNREFLQDAQMRKIYATYRRVRASNGAGREVSSPVCYADEFGVVQPGIVIDRYAFLATPADLAGQHCSVSPADYVR